MLCESDLTEPVTEIFCQCVILCESDLTEPVTEIFCQCVILCESNRTEPVTEIFCRSCFKKIMIMILLNIYLCPHIVEEVALCNC